MLDIEGCDHIDPGIQQILYILVAPGVYGTWRVGMGQLIDQSHIGVTGDKRLGIHLLQRDAAISDLFAWDDL